MNTCNKGYKVLLKESQEKTESEMESLPVCGCCGRQVYVHALNEHGDDYEQYTLVDYALLRMPSGDSYFEFLNKKGNVFIASCAECDTYAESEVSVEDAVKQWREGHIGTGI